MKRPAKTPALDPENPHSAIYLASRREWNERYGSYIAQRDNWRLMAFASTAVALVAVGCVGWIAAQSRVVPYVVRVNQLGDQVVVGRADVAGPVSPDVIRAQLARFITDTRSVYTDATATAANINEAAAMLDHHSAAFAFVNDWWSANPFYVRAAKETATVHVASVLPMPGGKTWRVEWQEDVMTRDGRTQSTKFWEAILTIGFAPPETEKAILENPTGLFIVEASWGERATGDKVATRAP